MQDGSGFPEQEVRIGIEVVGGGFGDDIHAGEAGLPVFSVALAERLRAIQDDVGVMDDARVVETELERADVFRFVQSGGNDEIAENIAAAGGHNEGLRHAQYEIGRTKLPLAVEARNWRQIVRTAFGLTGFHPIGDEADL
jgi:hypothetical protein